MSEIVTRWRCVLASGRVVYLYGVLPSGPVLGESIRFSEPCGHYDKSTNLVHEPEWATMQDGRITS